MTTAPWFRSPIKGGIQRVLAEIPRRDAADRRVALAYHSVAPTGTRATSATSVFREHLGWLRDHCRIVPFGDLLTAPSDGRSTRPTVAITFDDGYDDNHTHALPVLRELGVPATFFVTTGFVDGEPVAAERLRRLWGPEMSNVRPLSWSQIDEMETTGMTVGAHTRTHPNLRSLGAGEARAEIAASRERLEERLGHPVTAFAYPFGDVRFHLSDETVALVRDCGIETAATIEYRGASRNEDPLLIPRLPVSNDPIEILEAKVRGRLDLLGTWRSRVPSWVTGPMSSGRKRARAAV